MLIKAEYKSTSENKMKFHITWISLNSMLYLYVILYFYALQLEGSKMSMKWNTGKGNVCWVLIHSNQSWFTQCWHYFLFLANPNPHIHIVPDITVYQYNLSPVCWFHGDMNTYLIVMLLNNTNKASVRFYDLLAANKTSHIEQKFNIWQHWKLCISY